MASSRVEVPLSELRELCTKSLKSLGYQPDEVEVLLEVRWLALMHRRGDGMKPHGGRGALDYERPYSPFYPTTGPHARTATGQQPGHREDHVGRPEQV